jgi:uncharacterized metal-binding protein
MQSGPNRKREAPIIYILACSGGSNLGQIANQAAVELAEENLGRIMCVPAVASRVNASVQEIRRVSIVITIEGCDCHCIGRILKGLGRTDVRKVVVSAAGIEKRPGFSCPTEDVERVKEAVRRVIVEA